MNKWTRPFEGKRPAAGPAAGGLGRLEHHYFAFLSYSHRDAAIADWLHGELESFRVPSSLAGRLTAAGVIPKRLTPIFRDRHELAAAHDLGSEIREALAASHCLIVLCSPAAAVSEWTNAEVEEFKRAHPEGCIIAAIVAGEPFASEIPGRAADECFPPALRQKYDRRGRPTGKRAEPLAADMREQGDGRRLGLLKIVAGMLGVGLDDLVQRDHLRRQRRLAGIAAASLAGMIIATILALTAIQARNEARDQRREAESLVEFMVGDLKDKLEPLGRLDILDSVGAKALAYYEQQDPSQLSDDALTQRSKALTLLGQVAADRGDLAAAIGYYEAAFAGTEEALRRSPEDPQRIYDHAQNVFYVGDIAFKRGQLKQAEASMRQYKKMAQQLIAADPTNPTWQMEGIYADNNLGVMLLSEGRYPEAAATFHNALVEREKLAADDPGNPQYKKALIEGLSWLVTARERQGRLADAIAAGDRQIALLEPLINDPAADAEYRRQAAVAFRAGGRIRAASGDLPGGIEKLQRSVALSERLTAAEPANSYWLAREAWARFELARLLIADNSIEQAAALTRGGCDAADRLVARDRSVVEWSLELRSECQELLTRLALSRGSAADAQEQAEQLVALARAEAARDPSRKAMKALSNAHLVHGLVLKAAGNNAAASRAFREAAAAWPNDLPPQPVDVARRALILKGIGRSDEAARLASRLEQAGYRELIYLRDSRAIG